MAQHIGILTSGGDCPGLNAAIRGLGKAAREHYGMRVIGFLGGFRGLAMDQTVELDGAMLSGILTDGGTILGTSRDKPHRMNIGGRETDMTDAIIDTYHRHHLDALVCIGGGGTQKNALRLVERGLNVVTLPKTIDNDISMTDRTFGFDTALGIATEAIDRLHSTATSHERVIVLEVMGHRAGWLALEAGIAGGADVILLPGDSLRRGKNRGGDPAADAEREAVQHRGGGRGRDVHRRRAPRGGAGAGAGRGGLEKGACRGEGKAAEISRRARRPHDPPDEESGETHGAGKPVDDSGPPAAWRDAFGGGPGVRDVAGHRMRGRSQ